MNKIIVGAIIFALLLFLHFQHIEKYFKEIQKTIEANSIVLMKIADEKGANSNEKKLAKLNLNIESFQGLDCARCHITNENLLLPLNRISMEEYINIVRNGILKDNKQIMPSYDTQTITDNTLKVQYRILSKYFEK